jgi:hypothetical protein
VISLCRVRIFKDYKIEQSLNNFYKSSFHILTQVYSTYNFQAALIWWDGPFNKIRNYVSDQITFSFVLQASSF